ncbi:hypothetical protein FJTKL_08903 [Diaporthe vaccinii]|uniref:Uncharacterized protein n=1 Tax=Diaporthe vaccinii TaxID=105482 RepID=A0ABR4EQG7_9PEZI
MTKLQTVLKYSRQSRQQSCTVRRTHRKALRNQRITLTYSYREYRTQKNRSFPHRVPHTYADSVGLLPTVSSLKSRASPFPCGTSHNQLLLSPGMASSQSATEHATARSALSRRSFRVRQSCRFAWP